MPVTLEAAAPARPAPAAGTPARRAARGDLVLIEPTDPARIRRALWELDCVRAVMITGGVCRVWADGGRAGRVVEALVAEGLTPALLTLRWRPERPPAVLRPSSPEIAADAAGTARLAAHPPAARPAAPAAPAPSRWSRLLPLRRLAARDGRTAGRRLTRMIVVTAACDLN